MNYRNIAFFVLLAFATVAYAGVTNLDSLTLSDDLIVGGDATIGDDLGVTGDLAVTGALSVTGAVTNAGAQSFTGTVSFSGVSTATAQFSINKLVVPALSDPPFAESTPTGAIWMTVQSPGTHYVSDGSGGTEAAQGDELYVWARTAWEPLM